MQKNHADILVIGAGIAGASVAAHLAETRSVILVEREERPGYHSTGRSAALFTEIYGNATIRALTRASRRFLFGPPAEFTDGPLTRPRGCLYIATAAQLPAMSEFRALPDIAPATRILDVEEAHALCPILRREYLAGAVARAGLCRHRRPRAAPGLPSPVQEARRPADQRRAGAFARLRERRLERAGGNRQPDGLAGRERRRGLGGRSGGARGNRADRPHTPAPHGHARSTRRRTSPSAAGPSSTTSTSSSTSSPTPARYFFPRPMKRRPSPATRNPRSGTSPPPSTGSSRRRPSRYAVSRPAGRVFGPSPPTARPWWGIRRPRPRSFGSRGRAAMGSRRLRRSRAPRRLWSWDLRFPTT